MRNNIKHLSCLLTAFVIVFCFIFSYGDFTALGGSTPSIFLPQNSAEQGEDITVQYSGADSSDWIGIYPKGYIPGPSYPSLRWCYTGNGSGTVSLISQSEVNAYVPLPAGAYEIFLLDNGGYTILDRKEFTVLPATAGDYAPADITIGSGRTITVTPGKKYNSMVSFALYLSTDSGKLDGYTSLGNVTLKNNQYVYTVGERVVIPSEATHIRAYAVVGGAETSSFVACKIPNAAFYNHSALGAKRYEFQLFTDIHINADRNTSEYSIHSQHFTQALQDVLNTSPDSKAIITIGDNTDTGRESDWQLFNSLKNAVLTNGKPQMYFTIGNHDRGINANAGSSYESEVALFKKYTGAPGVYYSFKIENNTFIILGSENKSNPVYASLSNTQLNWLKAELEKTSPNDPVFIFIHEPLKDTTSGTLSYLNPTIQDWFGVEQNDELQAIVNPYPNVMFFTGHTHWHFNTTQPMLYGGGKTANYFNSAAVGYLWDDNDQYVDGSEGYFIEVYEKGLMVRGRDFVNGKWMPAAQFLIPMGTATAKHGDVNGDGEINGQDAVLLQQYLAEWSVTVSETGADVNGDGKINGQDAVLLQQYLAEWSVTIG